MPKIDPHNYPGPLEDLEKKQAQQKTPKNNAGVKVGVVFALIGLFVAGLTSYIIYTGETHIIEELIEEGGILTFIPFWLIIFIPFMFGKKKKK